MTLTEWLAWQERLHPQAIDLGLERVAVVRDALGLAQPPYRVITVGGTNGKGSCAAWLTALLRAAGHRVGTFTSPHLIEYNERIVVDGVDAGDAELCEAFEAVDRARGDESLTYFEFGALAALHHFRESGCTVVVLEVGMGGRLDATNTLDADAAVVVSVGIDHTEWLGDDREAIGYEKAGIFRSGRPAVCGDPNPPRSLLDHVERIGAHLVLTGRHYGHTVHGDGSWDFRGLNTEYTDLPQPNLPGFMQYGNAATALAALDAVPDLFPPDRDAVARGLVSARLRGRFERLSDTPRIVLDVAHNPDGARMLARQLAAEPVSGRRLAVCAMFADKQVEATLAALDAEVDHWLLAGLEGPRAATGAELAARAGRAGLHGSIEACIDVPTALARARALAAPDDRIVVFGSFLTVAAAMRPV
ncbi:MAG: bifunctional tetrahydrofolate synthase/dihydrofolate synthase [Xanthomonadaceae bacterium]|nr:bifunctional tetrahydrofolate synthase/dihydrofolate synthase [Xanthomonadaceae bacterium]